MVYKKAEKSKKKPFLARIVNVLVLINSKSIFTEERISF